MRNLLIFLTLFFLSTFSFSSQTLYYYKKTSGTVMCATDYSSICSTYESDTRSSLASNHVLQDFTCSLNASFSIVSSWKKYYTNGQYFGSQNNASIGSRRSIVCPDNHTVKLEGCTAACQVPPPVDPPADDPCKSEKGKIEKLSVQCGTFTCPAGAKTVLSGGVIVCDTAPGSFSSGTVPLAAKKNNCALEAQAVPDSFSIADARGLLNELGRQNQAGFCGIEYKYTGTTSEGVDTPTIAAGLSFNASYVPRDPLTGECPPNLPKQGEFNGQIVCVADSGDEDEGGECPTGQIKVGGVCTSSGGDDGNGDDGNGSGGNDNGDDGGIPCPTGQNKINGVCAPTGGTSQDRNYTASSNCDAAPVCDGDVVQCGLMQEAYISKCQLLKSMTEMPEDLKEQLEKVGTESDSSEVSSAKNVANSYLNAMSAAMHFSNSSCPGDFSIAVMGRSISIAISQVFDLFRILRLMLHLAAYFFCLRMLWMSLSTI